LIDKIIISPHEDKVISIADMESIFDQAGADYETIFRRLEFNLVIRYTKGTGIDFGCGLNKIHSFAIGIDFQQGKKDAGYPFGANIKIAKLKNELKLDWFNNSSLDYVFSSHCLEHFADPFDIISEMLSKIKDGGYLVIILPDMNYYPKTGESTSNEDHEWDCYPNIFVDQVKARFPVEVVQHNTVHSKLENVRLSDRDKRIADHYGHKSLNFSFESVFQKLPG